MILSLIPPAVLLAFAVSSAYAAIFNLLRGGGFSELLFYLVASWVGFAVGQVGGWLIGLDLGMVGSLYLIEGTIFAWLLMLVMNWLRMPKESA